MVAFAIGKKVGGAVVRNRLRRRLREVIRRYSELPSGAYLIRTTPAAASLKFLALSDHFARAVRAATGTAPPQPAHRALVPGVRDVPCSPER